MLHHVFFILLMATCGMLFSSQYTVQQIVPINGAVGYNVSFNPVAKQCIINNRIIDTTSGKDIFTFDNDVRSAQFNASGGHILLTRNTEPNSLQCEVVSLHPFLGHELKSEYKRTSYQGKTAEFTPSGKRILYKCENDVNLYNMASSYIDSKKYIFDACKIQESLDGCTILVHTLPKAYVMKNGKTIYSCTDDIQDINMSDDGRILCKQNKDASYDIIRISDSFVIAHMPAESYLTLLALTEKYILFGKRDVKSDTCNIQLINTNTGRCDVTLSVENLNAGFAAHGSYLYFYHGSKMFIKIADLLHIIARNKKHTVNDITPNAIVIPKGCKGHLSPHGDLLYVEFFNGSAFIVDNTTRAVILRLENANDAIFHPSGNSLLVAQNKIASAKIIHFIKQMAKL